MNSADDCAAKTREQVVGVLSGAAKLVAFIGCPIASAGIALF